MGVNKVFPFSYFNFLIGSVPMSYYLFSSQYVPQRMKKNIDETTSSMIENGLQLFYGRFSQFLTKLRAQKLLKAEGEIFHVLTMGDLKGPFIFCSCLWVFSWCFLVLEVLIKKWKLRLNRKYHARRPQIRVTNLINRTKSMEMKYSRSFSRRKTI